MELVRQKVSTRWQMFFKIDVFLKFLNIHRKTEEEDTPYRCFSVNIAKILKAAFFIEHLRCLFLIVENLVTIFGCFGCISLILRG